MSRNLEIHKDQAPQLRQRFWDLFQKRPDSIKNYAKLVGIPYRAFGDFVMGRSILESKTYAKFENWVIEEERKI